MRRLTVVAVVVSLIVSIAVTAPRATGPPDFSEQKVLSLRAWGDLYAHMCRLSYERGLAKLSDPAEPDVVKAQLQEAMSKMYAVALDMIVLLATHSGGVRERSRGLVLLEQCADMAE